MLTADAEREDLSSVWNVLLRVLGWFRLQKHEILQCWSVAECDESIRMKLEKKHDPKIR